MVKLLTHWWTIGVVDYLVVLIFEPLCSYMVRDAKVTSSILVWSNFFLSQQEHDSHVTLLV